MAYSSLMHGVLSSPVTLIWWYGVLQVISLSTYLAWMWNEERVSSNTSSVYIGFVVVSLVVYFTAGSTSLLWARRKGLSSEERSQKVQVAVLALFLVSDTPLVITNLMLARDVRLVSVIQGVDCVLRVISFFFGFLFLWIVYMMKFAALFHSRGYSRNPLDGPQLVNNSETAPRPRGSSARRLGNTGSSAMRGGGGGGGGGGYFRWGGWGSRGPANQQHLRHAYNLNAVGGLET